MIRTCAIRGGELLHCYLEGILKSLHTLRDAFSTVAKMWAYWPR